MTVQRNEIIDYETYKESMSETRPKIIQVKKSRRIHLGDYLTFLFENSTTIKYQIQEIVLAEKIVKEDDIQHEIDTYNELFGEKGSLPCVLMVEIDDVEERQVKLREWYDLPKHIYVKTEQGNSYYATYDKRQMSEEKLSSVQYLNFDTKGENPILVGSDLEQLKGEVKLTEEQFDSLKLDVKALNS